MQYNSTISIPSKIDPEVTFRIREMSAGLRIQLQLALAEAIDEVRELQLKFNDLDLPRTDEGIIDESATTGPRKLIEIDALLAKIRFTKNSKISPVYVDNCFEGVDGLNIDGDSAPSLTLFRTRGPELLYDEMAEYIRRRVELSAEERENLESPTTLTAAVGGPTSDMTADSAKSTNSIVLETVASSSLETSTLPA